MSLIESLSLEKTSSLPNKSRGIGSMRQKLIDRITDQISLAEAIAEGCSHQRVRYRRVRDLETDEIAETPVHTRIRPWWIQDSDGSLLLRIKYGNHALELTKGKTAIRVKEKSELIDTLNKVIEAVRAGELDPQILSAVDKFKERFSKG